MSTEFSHIGPEGARMVDVGGKEKSHRIAVASASIHAQASTLDRIREGRIEKGAVLETARIAGIQAAKKTSDLIPLCHPLALTNIQIEFSLGETLEITGTVESVDRTGVEMEALTAVTVASLTVYDMCKAVDRGMEIHRIALLEKRGGKSGDYRKS
ncbi:MAG: cyclic pyranopterin monophosphate synthase MoaC [Planctomycetota bacterium]|nr:cyclic pyranopterin monophosphate synthase MoaC [Planctomycetota bacterium]